MSLVLLVVALVSAYDVPPVHAVACTAAATRHGVDPVVLCAYLVSEHPGGRYSGECSDAGACGPYQLSRGWVAWAGYETGARSDPWQSADIAAQVVLYSQQRHEDRCGAHPGHGWRAHLKAGPGQRDNVGWEVRRWRDIEAGLRGVGAGSSQSSLARSVYTAGFRQNGAGFYGT